MQEKFSLSFLGIGSGKCGTTWLYNCLIEHPEICSINPKEINYFSYLYNLHNFIWYKRQFKDCGNLLKGEFSVSYMEDPNAAKRIRKWLPEVKIIAILRDPVRKVYSNYQHSIRKREINKNLSFNDYIKEEKYLFYGKYYEHLVPFYENLYESKIEIVILEDFKKDIIKNLSYLYEYIGVNNIEFIPNSINKRVNVSKNYRFLLLEQLITNTSKYLNRRGNTIFVEQMKKAGIPSLLRKLNEKRDSADKEINYECQNFLKKYYKEFNHKLEELIQKDLSIWME